MMPVVIPKVFHQIWLGPEPMPKECAAWRQSWLEKHPGWSARLWIETALPPLANGALMAKCANRAQQSDLVRYELLEQCGGVYVDIDMECLKNIEPLIESHAFFATRSGMSDPSHSTAIFGAVPHHPIMKELVKSFRNAFKIDPTWWIGPGYFSETVRRHPEAKILDYRLFHPFTRSEKVRSIRSSKPLTPPKGTYAMNHRLSAWYDGSTERIDR